MIKISPSILAADFANLESEIKKIEVEADALHLDIMDGAFVPNISFGLPVVRDIRKVTSLILDVHLMIEKPDNFIADFADAGADYITVQAEACTHLHRTVTQIKSLGCKAGVSLNPHTSENVLKYILDEIDLVLVMGVNPGFGGQTFIGAMIRKIKAIKKMVDKLDKEIIIAVDGGVNLSTISKIVNAGATFVVAGSAVFKSKDPAEAIRELKGKGKEKEPAKQTL